jgi:tRNA G18 (ribose-2'-O)-methylase SpoU
LRQPPPQRALTRRVARSRAYRDAAGTLLLAGGRVLEEVAGTADLPAGADGAPLPPPLRVRVLLLAPGAPPPRGVLAERTITASPEVLRKARRAAATCSAPGAQPQPRDKCADGACAPPARQIAGVESGDALDALAELPAPRVHTPSLEQARAAQQRSSAHHLAPCTRLIPPPRAHAQASAAPRVLLLDGVQDPGNLGTLLRSAAAFQWDAACLLPGCCDPFNSKAVRASRGAALRLPLWRATWSQLAALADATGAACLGADPRGDATGAVLAAAAKAAAAPRAKPLWLALGAEGPGLSLQAAALCTPVAIPRAGKRRCENADGGLQIAPLTRLRRAAGGMESLNVAAAGSILMYALAAPTAAERSAAQRSV